MDECIACDNEAEVRLGAGPDMKGIPVCKEHKGDVQIDLLILFSDDEEFDEEWFNKKYDIE